jgi:hypothetical protein
MTDLAPPFGLAILTINWGNEAQRSRRAGLGSKLLAWPFVVQSVTAMLKQGIQNVLAAGSRYTPPHL